MYHIYVVTHRHGTDLFSWTGLVDYCKNWWDEWSPPDLEFSDLNDDEIVRTYFEMSDGFEWSEFHVVEDMEPFKVG